MSLQEFLEYIPDMRDTKNQLFTCSEIVFIAMVSVLCGAETWPEVEMFGKSHIDYFKRRLPNLLRIPSEDTFECFFLLLDTAWFERAFREWVADISFKKCYFQDNKGHGRNEYRECVCDTAFMPEHYYKGWEGIKTIAKVTCIRQVGNGEPTTETRCYISSLPADPKLILDSVRSHWQVENSLHWQLDVSFREDYTRKTGNAAIVAGMPCTTPTDGCQYY